MSLALTVPLEVIEHATVIDLQVGDIVVDSEMVPFDGVGVIQLVTRALDGSHYNVSVICLDGESVQLAKIKLAPRMFIGRMKGTNAFDLCIASLRATCREFA